MGELLDLIAERELSWLGGELRAEHSDPGRRPLAADSWLLVDGATRAAERHWDRFARSCAELGVPAAEIAGFRAAVQAALPTAGRWFPRVALAERAGDRRLQLLIRPAPPERLDARVWAAPAGDPRTAPRRKGPDLARLAALREQAREAGADEALIRDERGHVLEGALSSVLWWEGDVLFTTPDATALPGVTRGLLLEIASRRGVEVRHEAPAPERLGGVECWLTSALYGIRTVSEWVEPRQAAGASPRAPEWRRELSAYR